MAQQSTQPHPYTRDIAEFVSGLTYDKIPEEVRHRNKLLMLDSLGCALYGADLEWTRILQDKLSSVDSTRQCSSNRATMAASCGAASSRPSSVSSSR